MGAGGGAQQKDQSHVVAVEEGVPRADVFDGVGGEEGKAGALEDHGAAVWLPARSLLVLTVVTWDTHTHVKMCTCTQDMSTNPN